MTIKQKRQIGKKIGGYLSLFFATSWMYVLGWAHINTAEHPLLAVPAFIAVMLGAQLLQCRVNFRLGRRTTKVRIAK